MVVQVRVPPELLGFISAQTKTQHGIIIKTILKKFVMQDLDQIWVGDQLMGVDEDSILPTIIP